MSAEPFFPVPSAIARTAAELRGPLGLAWLERLPGIVAGCADRWSLALDPPFPNLSYNYAAPGRNAAGEAVVLKVCFPDREFYTEAEALRLCSGRGMATLLDSDLDQGALLLERLSPGSPLEELPSEEQRNSLAVQVMRRLWRPAPANLAVSKDYNFPNFSDWMAHMGRLAPGMVEPHSPFPARWVELALGLFADLSAGEDEQLLLHGDLHHGNILSARRSPWLAIDPKGVVGPPVCETGPLLINALPPSLELQETRRLLERRTEQLAGELQLDLARLRAWGVVRSALSSFWSLEDHGYGWEGDLVVVEILADLSRRG